MRLGVVALAMLACVVRGQEAKDQPEPRYRIEVLYTIHARLDTDEKLERIRALVKKAYPEAKFAEHTIGDRRTYYGTYTERLLRMAGTSLAAAEENGYEIVKEQVDREVSLRYVYEFLHAQARDDVSLKVVFDKLKAKDDPKNPVCSTEPGKALIVYRDFGGKGLTRGELAAIDDGGVNFGASFRARVTVCPTEDVPKLGRKPDTLGDEGDGRQILRLVAVDQ